MKKPCVLVTGASTGIGRALAKKFAAKGFDVIAVARTESDLASLANECSEKYSATVLAISKDLTSPTSAHELFEQVERKTLEVDVLVNNAGFGVHGDFLDSSLEKNLELVNLQIRSLLQLTYLFVSKMRKRGRGRVLNVASVYAYSPVPFQSVYSGTKAFMLTFSNALAEELKTSGVTVTVLCPGTTQSEFRKRAGMHEKSSTSGMTAEEVAEIGYRAVMMGKRVCVPGLLNKIFVFLTHILSKPLAASLMRRINQVRGIYTPT